jgi:UDP-N-acetylmuramate-alanine ligase
MHDRAVLVDEKNDIHTLLQREGALDGVIVFMGAGDIDDVAREFANSG